MTRYWARVARPLWETRDQWRPVAGWRLVEPEQVRYPTGGRDPQAVEVLVEDDGAPDVLAGHLVEPIFQSGPEGVVVTGRLQMD